MSYEMNLSIPIQSHLKKMIGKFHAVEPFRIKVGRCPYSSIIYNTLQKQSIRVKPTKEDKFNDKLDIIIPSDLTKQMSWYLNDRGISAINSALRGLFQERLILHLTYTCEDKGDIKKDILSFLEMHGIEEEEFSYEACKKMFYRYRRNTGALQSKNYRTKGTKKVKPTIKTGKIVTMEDGKSIQGDLFQII